jgi:glutamate-1-semialdehyde 2,1-aminomutase
MVSQMELLSNSNGYKLWNKATQIIPGGNSLLSKRPDRYAPGIWPTYFSRAKGCEIWDIDGNKYIDMAQMGIGTAILGYCNDEVDAAVVDAVNSGISTTLNAPEEVALAESLLNSNPFAGGVKFARTGGEAMAIAVRIARAHSKRDTIAFSGYHGWSDWYLASNLSSANNLTDHLLPGLDPLGVPSGLEGTIYPFKYNDVDDFSRVIERHPDVGTIVIEGARYDYPSEEFLHIISSTAKKYGIVIISDEITSGWRVSNGGVYKTKNFIPDIVVYGKGMGNGYAISAVVGKKDIMNIAQDTFISSTFWTERIGFVAALKTLEIFKRDRVWEHLMEIGSLIGEGWLRLAKKHGLILQITDFKPLITMKFGYSDTNQEIITLFTQEMLKRGYLASTSVYVSIAHSKEIVEDYLKHVDSVFNVISKAISDQNVQSLLECSVKVDGFKRLT